MNEEDDVVTLSEIEHFAYCSRQWALITMERTWNDNLSTVRGSLAHERVDAPSVRAERGRRVLRGLTVWSDRHGLFGRADVVEIPSAGAPVPVEYKSGSAAAMPARLQLAAQAVCLEEMFDCAVPEGVLWLGRARRRVSVPIGEQLRAELLQVVDQIRAARRSLGLPRARFDRRCRDCSLINECLPQLVEDWRGMATIHGMLFTARGGGTIA